MLSNLLTFVPLSARLAGRGRSAANVTARPSCAPALRALTKRHSLRDAPAPVRPARRGAASRALPGNKFAVAAAAPSANAMSTDMKDSGTLLSSVLENPVLTGGIVMASVAALALINPALHLAVTSPLPVAMGIVSPMIDMSNGAMMLMVALQAGLASIDLLHANTAATPLHMENAAVKHGTCSAALLLAYMTGVNAEPFTLFCASFFGMTALWAHKVAGSAAMPKPVLALNTLLAEAVLALGTGFALMFTQINPLAMLLAPLGLTPPALMLGAPWDILVPTLMMGLGASRLHASMHAPGRRDFSVAAGSSAVIAGVVMVMSVMGRAAMADLMIVLCMPGLMGMLHFMTANQMRDE